MRKSLHRKIILTKLCRPKPVTSLRLVRLSAPCASGKKEQKDVTSDKKWKKKGKRKKKLLAGVAEASSATGTQKAERAELKVNDGGVPMYV